MGERYPPSSEHLADLLGMIYDCVLAPDRWTPTIDAIRKAFDFHNGIMAINGYDGRTLVGAIVGVEDVWLSRMFSHGTAITDLWGGMARIAQYPIEEPVVQSWAMPHYDRERNSYFAEWAKPQGIIDAVTVGLVRDGEGVSNVAFGRHESAGPIRETEVDHLRLLAPHLRRAVAISRVLDLKTIEAAAFAAALDAARSAILIVDADGRCLHANGAAAAMLDGRDPIALKDGELVLSHAAGTTALRSAIRGAAVRLVHSRSPGAGIPTTRRDGTPAVLHVMPLHRPELSRPLGPHAAAAVFVSSHGAAPHMPADALGVIYELTPAEIRVFDLVAQGRTPSEIAATLGLALSTVKTHLGRVFEKTGCKRQADLIRLAGSLAQPF